VRLFIFALILAATGLECGQAGSTGFEKPEDLGKGKRILWVSSYHQGYQTHDDEERGIRRVLKDTGVELRIFQMNTTQNDSEEFGMQAGLEALALVKEFQPDIVIASDDNAQKYFVVPHLKDTELPVVFCGVFMDASVYGYPCRNVTGMVEVDLTREMLQHFRRYARGDRIGYLSGDMDLERRIIDIYNKRFFNGAMKSYLVTSMDDFRAKFLRAQTEVDMLYIYNHSGIKDWDRLEAKAFLARHTSIPTGSHHGFMAPFVVFVVAKSMEEHGAYAAHAALRILRGAKPWDIPLTENRSAQLVVNLEMAKQAGIILPVSVLKTATVIGQEVYHRKTAPQNFQPGRYKGKKVLWVDSYHEGYEWSDELGEGIRQVLFETGVQLRIFRMNTKWNDTVEFGWEAGRKARAVVDEFKPDVLIASDDNAQKYLVAPYLKNANLPVVFCGVNWDASIYGFPSKNITGMIEVDMTQDMVRHLRQHARGDRIGYLSGDVETERRIVDIYNERFFHGAMKSYLVSSMEELQKEYLRAQEEVDMLYVYNYSGIRGWDPAAAEAFIARNTRIPTGSHNGFMAPFVVFTLAKSSEEQGSFAAGAALQILDGVKPEDIPLQTNELSKLTINLKIAKSAGIVLPFSSLKDAKVIGQEALNE
jgi:ABC-type uncharacterized transport system substrate-binding protein